MSFPTAYEIRQKALAERWEELPPEVKNAANGVAEELMRSPQDAASVELDLPNFEWHQLKGFLRLAGFTCVLYEEAKPKPFIEVEL